jgi:hypothetical protein
MSSDRTARVVASDVAAWSAIGAVGENAARASVTSIRTARSKAMSPRTASTRAGSWSKRCWRATSIFAHALSIRR